VRARMFAYFCVMGGCRVIWVCKEVKNPISLCVIVRYNAMRCIGLIFSIFKTRPQAFTLRLHLVGIHARVRISVISLPPRGFKYPRHI
jgi:hypothetical protein